MGVLYWGEKGSYRMKRKFYEGGQDGQKGEKKNPQIFYGERLSMLKAQLGERKRGEESRTWKKG